MAEVHSFTFNDFQENTYIVYDETKECVIFDPGCSNRDECMKLVDYIAKNGLTPVRLLNTHCHIDHILGNKFVSKKYNLALEIPEGELVMLQNGTRVAQMYGINYDPSPEPKSLLSEKDIVSFGNTVFELLFCPGHSPASICFFNKNDGFIIGGDVLFYESIGRTDLPGGDHQTLLTSIREKLFTLSDPTKVYPGHGPVTTIGHEKVYNPFV